MTHYGDDTTPDDIRRGDQCALVCPCGSRVILAWANLPEAQRFTSLRDMRAKMVCRRCGHRRPQIVISGHYGTGGAQAPKILIVAHWTWFAVQAAGRHLKTRNNGGLNYRGLDVWISDRTRIGTKADAEWLAEC